MKSMTGYGRGELTTGGQNICIQISSLNSKRLEVFVNQPREWQSLEHKIRELVVSRLGRGKIVVAIEKSEGQQFSENEIERLSHSFNSFKRLAKALGVDFKPDASFLLAFLNQAKTETNASVDSSLWEALAGGLGEALESLDQMRKAEGQHLFEDLSKRLDNLKNYFEEIKKAAPEVSEHYKAQLMNRLKEADFEFDLEDPRVLREIALFADRSDISEEMVRLESHFKHFGGNLKESGLIGRKLDFLCQEIGREINTIGSKANFSGISRYVVEAKNELERIREQVQNIE